MTPPYTMDIGVRFRDIDALGHVNNAVYATYLETARVGYFRDVIDASLVTNGTVIARLEIDFRRPIELDESVTVRLTVGDLGRSSIPMSYEVVADGEVAATAESVQVVYDNDRGETTPIPPRWRERIEAFEP